MKPKLKARVTTTTSAAVSNLVSFAARQHWRCSVTLLSWRKCSLSERERARKSQVWIECKARVLIKLSWRNVRIEYMHTHTHRTRTNLCCWVSRNQLLRRRWFVKKNLAKTQNMYIWHCASKRERMIKRVVEGVSKCLYLNNLCAAPETDSCFLLPLHWQRLGKLLSPSHTQTHSNTAESPQWPRPLDVLLSMTAFLVYFHFYQCRNITENYSII